MLFLKNEKALAEELEAGEVFTDTNVRDKEQKMDKEGNVIQEAIRTLTLDEVKPCRNDLVPPFWRLDISFESAPVW